MYMFTPHTYITHIYTYVYIYTDIYKDAHHIYVHIPIHTYTNIHTSRCIHIYRYNKILKCQKSLHMLLHKVNEYYLELCVDIKQVENRAFWVQGCSGISNNFCLLNIHSVLGTTQLTSGLCLSLVKEEIGHQVHENIEVQEETWLAHGHSASRSQSWTRLNLLLP